MLDATENYTYAYGTLSEIKLNGQTSVWKLTEENELGQPTKSQTGPLMRTYGYTQYGMPTSRTAGSVQNSSYNFDAMKGNLLNRTDNPRGVTESFGYDNLNRLSTINGQQMGYANNGNVTAMPGTGTMEYRYADKTYQISTLTPIGNAVPMRIQDLTYTSFQRPASITEETRSANFFYNAEGMDNPPELYYICRDYLGSITHITNASGSLT